MAARILAFVNIIALVLFPSPSPCSNMIRFTGMSKWVILFIHCSCLDPNITRRIKANESQQEVKRKKKGNVVFCLYSASVLVFISAVTADVIFTAAHSYIPSSVVDLTLYIFLLLELCHPLRPWMCTSKCACVFEQNRGSVLRTGCGCCFWTMLVWQPHYRSQLWLQESMPCIQHLTRKFLNYVSNQLD